MCKLSEKMTKSTHRLGQLVCPPPHCVSPFCKTGGFPRKASIDAFRTWNIYDIIEKDSIRIEFDMNNIFGKDDTKNDIPM